ncbi:MAG: hypothetical protein ABI634_16225 [Acidobacteriota bacterium]
MRTRISCLVLVLAAAASLWAQAPAPRRDRHVIVISLVGFPMYALADPALPVPNVRALARADT